MAGRFLGMGDAETRKEETGDAKGGGEAGAESLSRPEAVAPRTEMEASPRRAGTLHG